MPGCLRVSSIASRRMRTIKEQDSGHVRFGGFPHLNPVNGTKYRRAGFLGYALSKFSNAPTRHFVFRIKVKYLLSGQKVAVDWVNHFPFMRHEGFPNGNSLRNHLADSAANSRFISLLVCHDPTSP